MHNLPFLLCFKDGNDFGETYNEMQFFIPQVLVIKLEVEEPSIVFQPCMKDCWELICRCFMEILRNSEGLPMVCKSKGICFVESIADIAGSQNSLYFSKNPQYLSIVFSSRAPRGYSSTSFFIYKLFICPGFPSIHRMNPQDGLQNCRL